MAPRAIAAHATRSTETQEKLFIEGGKLSFALTLYFCGGLGCLGMPFIHRWQHGLQDSAYRLMLILLLGEVLPMSQWLTYSVIIGSGRHRVLAVLAACECVILTALATSVVGREGTAGVCYAVALSAFITRGVMQWLFGCRLLRIPALQYSKRVFAPVAFAALAPITALWVASVWAVPRTFTGIAVLGVSYSALFAITLGLLLLGYSRLKATVTILFPQLERRGC
jgi:O-antigen/teichoic acid export membrane protein